MPTGGILFVITEGTICGDSNNARKNLARAARRDQNSSCLTVTQSINEISTKDEEVFFGEEDLKTSRGEHNNALIISATISNFWVKKILVDSGSSADIIFHGAFQKLGMNNAQLTRVNAPLVGFSGVVEAVGEIALPIYLGSYPRRSTKMVKFLVVKAPLAYNVILGHPSLNLFHAIASTYHMKGIHLVDGESNDRERMTATEALKHVEVVPGDPRKTFRIGSDLPTEVENTLTTFLQCNIDTFAWDDDPLPGIPLEYALHHLNVDPQMKPIKQKRRYFCPDKINI
ncbi:uncharacterized protein LOC142530620 [Primulina tabacum]|uniref:uncharacterized protein LOC142530620 n=1 Tax=Primulina tabacum TaxID=48773 RepID=UPI003F5AB873